MPGTWRPVTPICSSKLTVATLSCKTWSEVGSFQCQSWADHGSSQCSAWADHGSNQCSAWADHGSSQCSAWADQGSSQCCTWWPCSWGCKAWYWVANWVCLAWYWVANLVCQAWYWVANWVCQAWYWVANWVCQAWYWIGYWVCTAWQTIVHVFCVKANGGPMFLLTDGTVLLNECSGGYGTRHWWRLTPDIGDSYLNGTWSRAADSHYGRKYFASAVLADGRLLVCGGEYSDVSGANAQDETTKTEIYDPVTDAWTQVAVPTSISQIGDSPCCVLPDGRFLLGSLSGPSTFVFNPSTGTWTTAATKGDSGSEETWVLMADGTVVTPQCTLAPSAEKYVVASNSWVSAGNLTPILNLVEASSLEIGPGMLLPDGRAFFVGARDGRTALYTPDSSPMTPGTWAAGPTIPATASGQSQGSKDGPGALLPSGNVLFPAAPVNGIAGAFLPPCSFYEFGGGALTRVNDPPNANCPTYVGRMLLIPTGQVLWAREDDPRIYAYTEAAAVPDSFRPAIVSATPMVAGSTATVSGTQFNGLSQAVGYGDDYAAATNYPLVRLRHLGSGHIRYCRTFGHNVGGSTPSMGVATGSTVVTTNVTVPSTIDRGDSELVVVANGIPSKPRVVTVK
jgi:hypothetical protein